MAHPSDADQGRSRARAVTAAPGQPRPPTAASSHRRRGTAIRAGAIAAIIAGSAVALYAERGTIANGLVSFKQADPGWVAAGFVAEYVSMAAFALLQQRLLRAAAATLTLGSLTAIAYASNAITLAVPVAGSGLAAAYSQRQFRARGADTPTVSLTLLIAGVISTVAFAVIAAVGAVATGNLAAAIAAIGVPVPWDKLLLIWSAGAAAASFSPTPYGLGVVDIALITALHAAGTASPEAIGAVLLYRIITFKSLVTLLRIGYRYLQDRSYPGVT